MIVPAASVCGWYFAHPQATYFSVGKIQEDQVSDYARRLSVDIGEVRQRIRESLPPVPVVVSRT